VEARTTVDDYARLTRSRLSATMLPYWLRVSRDDLAGGYLLHNDVLRGPLRGASHAVLKRTVRRPVDDKQLVSQARLVWVFAHAHRHGLDDGTAYLDAATQGWRFLVEHFRDPEHDGYRWLTDRAGTPRNEVKVLYGQAFVIYAFVELARATGDAAPLDDALSLFRAIDRELHDDEHRGWHEHAHADWTPLAHGAPRSGMPYAGRKSANTLVHWMEAVTELYDATHDDGARRALVEALDLCRDPVYPSDPGATHEPLLPDWTPDPEGEHRASYGHNVEFAWLMLHAQQVLGDPLDWDRFHTYVDHALRVGFDDERGGLFTAGPGDEPATERRKLWWGQCELMNALCVALAHEHDDRYEAALAQTIIFVERSMTDPRDGILLEEVEADGRRSWPRKSGNWKAGYHDVRAAVRVSETFAP
jgi:mannobiose 2-epimerase